MPITITKEDVLRSKVLEQAWYPVTVTSYNEELTKKGDKVKHVFELKVDGPQTAAGKVIVVNFTEGSLGFAIPFINACGANINEQTIGEGTQIELASCVNKKLEAFVTVDSYNGKPNNKVLDYRRKK